MESWRSRAAARSRSSDFLRASWLICSCTCAAAWQADYRMLLRGWGCQKQPLAHALSRSQMPCGHLKR